MSEKINIEMQSNIFQKYLIPEESHWVRTVLQKAGEWGKSPSILYSRVLTVALAVCAVILSLLNTISYILEIPIKILLNIIHLHPLNLITEFINDISSALRSFFFVSFGVTFIIAGVLFPAVVFPYFAPEDPKNSYRSLQNENLKLKDRMQKIETQIHDLEILRESLIKHSDAQNNQTKDISSSWRFC